MPRRIVDIHIDGLKARHVQQVLSAARDSHDGCVAYWNLVIGLVAQAELQIEDRIGRVTVSIDMADIDELPNGVFADMLVESIAAVNRFTTVPIDLLLGGVSMALAYSARQRLTKV